MAKLLLAHPIADLFPMLPDDELNVLADDIKQRGLLIPIVLYEGKILDGRNRHTACEMAGVSPRFETWDPKKHGTLEAFLHAKSLNMIRRHLPQEQRGAIMQLSIDKVPELRKKVEAIQAAAHQRKTDGGKKAGRGRPKNSLGPHGPKLSRAADEIAKVYGVSSRTVKRIQKLAKESPKALIEVAHGGTSATKASRKAKAHAIATRVDWPKDKYRVIYADPPWSYGNTQPDYHTEQRDHYPVMQLQEICDLPVKDLAMTDSVLFLWVTSPVLEESFRVIKAWGFKYKASFVWDKVSHNMGHYNSVRHEFLLICVRGSCQPDVPKLFDSVVTEKRGKHSRKPQCFYDMIETLYPHGPRIELFGREARKNWQSYGYEAHK